MSAVLHSSKKIELNEGMKVMLKKDRRKVTDEIWLILGKYAPNDKNRFENFSEWIPDDAEKVEDFVKLMAYNELKITKKAWNNVYKLFSEFDNLVGGADTKTVVFNVFNDFVSNQFTSLLIQNNFTADEHKNILRCYCSYLGMKKGRNISSALLKTRSQYVFSYINLYPKIEYGNAEYDDGAGHWSDLQVTYADEIGSVLMNLSHQ